LPEPALLDARIAGAAAAVARGQWDDVARRGRRPATAVVDRQGECFPAVRTLASDCTMSSSVHRAITEMRELDYISIRRHGKHNVYRIAERLLVPPADCPAGEDDCPGGGTEGEAKNESHSSSKKKRRRT
jgi:hypothetical protein